MPNAKVLESKKAIVDELTGKIQGASSVVFVDYKGINVAQDTDLHIQRKEPTRCHIAAHYFYPHISKIAKKP